MKKIISMLLTVVMCFSLMTVSFAAEMNFIDVKSTDWFYNDVKTAVEMGLVNGKSATTYAPNDNLTYAEAIKLAACMNMLYTQGEINIKAGSPWYQPYVDYCVEYNIICYRSFKVIFICAFLFCIPTAEGIACSFGCRRFSKSGLVFNC